MSFCPMSWAAVGPAGVGVWPGVGRGVAIGVGAGVTSGVAVGVGEPVGAVVDPSAVSEGDADGVLEQPARSTTSRKAPDGLMVFGVRSSSSLNDAAAGPPVMPHAGRD